MSSSNVLKEFLVKIGFKLNETQFRNFQEGLRTIGKNFAELAKTGLAAGTALGAMTTVAARQMEGLYFAAQRTGASAKELQTFSFAAAQIGVSAEQAQGAIEGLAAARRTNPGLNGILGGLGIDPRQIDNAKVMVQLLTKLHSMPYFQGAQIAGLFGINESTFNMLEQGLPEMAKYLKIRENMFSEAGIDPQEMARRSHLFMDDARTLETRVGALADIIAFRLMPAGDRLIHMLEGITSWLTKADKSTGGWSSSLLGVISAILGIGSLKGGVGVGLKLLGRGGIATGEGTGALAGLVGTLVTTGLIAALVTAVVGIVKPEVILRMLGLPEHGHQMSDAIKKPFVAAADAVKEMHKEIKAAGGYVKALSVTGGPVGTLAAMVANFEGHVKGGYGVYKDIAGNLTAGFGHLVKKGEDFSHLDKAGALSLLAKDLGAAMSSVARLVKVHLNKNQADALADFVFNLGEGKFGKSTLLKKLNSGDFAGAADEFQRWNKALVNGHLVVNAGLSARRSAEANLFRTPDKGVQITQKTDIHVTGEGANDTAREVARQQSRVNGDLVRNFAGATF
jgi:GH24 family phage-related lysozyme (muramidase)